MTFASRQSTPDHELNAGTTGNLTRMPSDSDMASVISDEALSSPPSHKSLSTKAHWSIENILSASLSPAEREAVFQVDAASSLEDLELFARFVDDCKLFLHGVDLTAFVVRLCKYFRGKHHLEEIMYLENVRRSSLLHLLDKFRSILITFEHEDAACSVFYKSCAS